MSGNILIQIFIFIEVFLMGVVAVIAVQHAYAHFKPEKPEPERHDQPFINPIPPSMKEHFLKVSETQFQTVLKRSASQLQYDLEVSTEQINGLVKKLATEIVSAEMERYRIQLSQLHDQTETDMRGIRDEVTKHEAELKAKAAAEIEAEKKMLIKQIDTKLADAVGSFLVETLQHNIDLGNQGSYLVGMLEEHKADFTKEVSDESQPAK